MIVSTEKTEAANFGSPPLCVKKPLTSPFFGENVTEPGLPACYNNIDKYLKGEVYDEIKG